MRLNSSILTSKKALAVCAAWLRIGQWLRIEKTLYQREGWSLWRKAKQLFLVLLRETKKAVCIFWFVKIFDFNKQEGASSMRSLAAHRTLAAHRNFFQGKKTREISSNKNIIFVTKR